MSSEPLRLGQYRVCAFDEGAVVTGRRLRTSEIEPAGRGPRPGNKPRSVAIDGLQEVFPRNRIAAAAVGGRQHQIARRIDGRHDEGILRAGNGGHDVTPVTA